MKKYFITFLLLLAVACSKNSKMENLGDKILVRVGDRVITVKDFQNRMELTPRPFYCKGTTEKDKAIALNSMIAEKLMALETGTDCQPFKNEVFNSYIKGRQEQYMRDKLYELEAMKKVTLDSLEVLKGLDAAQMNYEVEYYMLPKTIANEIKTEVKKSPEAVSAIFKHMVDTQPPRTRAVKFLDNDIKPIQDILFKDVLPNDAIVGPLDIDGDNFLFMRVKDFKYTPAISETEHSKKVQLVVEKLTFDHAQQHWNDYVNKVMDGKKIDFNRKTFEALLKLFISKYQGADKENEFNLSEEINDILISKEQKIHTLLEEPFFEINGDVWTVAEFRKLVMSHPIVFRSDEIHSPREYVKAFRTAVLDVIQDHFVNQEGYKQNIDKLPEIQRKTLIWQDSFIAKYQQQKYLDDLSQRPDFDKSRLSGNENTYIDEYIDNLQEKYKSKIELNKEAWKQLKLISTDLFGMRPKTPYPDLVPPFPANAIDEKVDY